MAKEAEIKPEFLAKLKKLRVKTKFIKYWKENKWSPIEGMSEEEHEKNVKRYRKTAIEATNFITFVYNAFGWRETEEGICYWSDISEK